MTQFRDTGQLKIHVPLWQLLFRKQLAFSDFTIAPGSNAATAAAAMQGPCADLNNMKKGVNHLWP